MCSSRSALCSGVVITSRTLAFDKQAAMDCMPSLLGRISPERIEFFIDHVAEFDLHRFRHI